jgi:hypothetical protein
MPHYIFIKLRKKFLKNHLTVNFHDSWHLFYKHINDQILMIFLFSNR